MILVRTDTDDDDDDGVLTTCGMIYRLPVLRYDADDTLRV